MQAFIGDYIRPHGQADISEYQIVACLAYINCTEGIDGSIRYHNATPITVPQFNIVYKRLYGDPDSYDFDQAGGILTVYPGYPRSSYDLELVDEEQSARLEKFAGKNVEISREDDRKRRQRKRRWRMVSAFI
jgi:hypothetical protein